MATLYDYENRTALDPYTREGEPNAVGYVFDKSDITFQNPLTVTMVSSGLQAQELTTDQYCQLPSFRVEDRVQVVFKSGDFTKLLNTTTPLPGPAGPAVSEAVDNGNGTVTFLLSDGAEASTVNLPRGPEGAKGAQGPTGERGVPGINAVPAAEAVAEYATTPGNPVRDAIQRGGVFTGNVLHGGGDATLPFISTTAIGCTGTTDDTPKVQAAVDRLVTAGGGELVVDCPTLLNGQTSADGVTWAVSIGGDNITIRCTSNGLLRRTVASGAAFFAGGCGKGRAMTAWNSAKFTDAPVYTMNPVAKGDTSITLATPAEAGNFAPGDYIYVRTGQLTSNMNTWPEPDAELHRVSSVNTTTGVISLRGATGKPFAREYYQPLTVTQKAVASGVATLTLASLPAYRAGEQVAVSGVGAPFDGTFTITAVRRQAPFSVSYAVASPDVAATASGGQAVGQAGRTSTTVTVMPSPFGVANVTDRVIRNLRFDNLHIESDATDRNFISFWQVDGVTVDHCEGVGGAGLQTGRDFINGYITHNTWFGKGTADPLMSYACAVASGCGDVWITDNSFTSERGMFIHAHEGVVRTRILRNRVHSSKKTAINNSINLMSRGYDTWVRDNHVLNSHNTAIFIGEDCTGGGVVDGNTVAGTVAASAIAVYAPSGWTVGVNSTQTGRHSLAPLGGNSGPVAVQAMSGWVSHNTKTRTLGDIPENAVILDVFIQTTDAYNSAAASVKVGMVSDQSRYAAATDVLTAGIKTPVPGTGANAGGFIPSTQQVQAYLTATGATAGRTEIVVVYTIGAYKL